jgi:putative acetyltransferase
MNLLIRPVRLSDAEDINEMRRQKEVRVSTLALATETLLLTESFIRNFEMMTTFWWLRLMRK